MYDSTKLNFSDHDNTSGAEQTCLNGPELNRVKPCPLVFSQNPGLPKITEAGVGVKPIQTLCHIFRLIFVEQSNNRFSGACQGMNDKNENIDFSFKYSFAVLNTCQKKKT